jgi:hypothetical protein
MALVRYSSDVGRRNAKPLGNTLGWGHLRSDGFAVSIVSTRVCACVYVQYRRYSAELLCPR